MLHLKYSFDEKEWNVKELNSPMPCPTASMCSTPNCHLVHPGEEGLRRKLFPGRQMVDRVTGKPTQQRPCVRLVGRNKDDVPSFYVRRAKKMSWLDWCRQENIEHPFLVYEKIHSLGSKIYNEVDSYLPLVEPAARDKKCWVEGFNAGSATAMILESLSTNLIEAEAYVEYLLNDFAEFERTMVECIMVYAGHTSNFV